MIKTLLVFVCVLFITTAHATLPVKTNNWMSVQGNHNWQGLSNTQIHSRQLNFINPEYGIRAGAISLITRALRKNNKPEITLHQIFFDADGWAEDKESYRLNMISKGFNETFVVNVMNKNEMKILINFIINHEMGVTEYNKLTNKTTTIEKGLDMAYNYVLSDEYSLKDLVN